MLSVYFPLWYLYIFYLKKSFTISKVLPLASIKAIAVGSGIVVILMLEPVGPSTLTSPDICSSESYVDITAQYVVSDSKFCVNSN